MDPLGFLITLVLCPGVATSFWCLHVMCWWPCVALTLGVGYDVVDTPWHGVPGARLVSREPCSHRSGPYVETSAGLPADGTWIGDKPGLET